MQCTALRYYMLLKNSLAARSWCRKSRSRFATYLRDSPDSSCTCAAHNSRCHESGSALPCAPAPHLRVKEVCRLNLWKPPPPHNPSEPRPPSGSCWNSPLSLPHCHIPPGSGSGHPWYWTCAPGLSGSDTPYRASPPESRPPAESPRSHSPEFLPLPLRDPASSAY